MLLASKSPKIALPTGWNRCVRSAILHVISVAHFSLSYARGWAVDSVNARLRLSAEKSRLVDEVAMLREEVRTKDARMARIAPQRRPHYTPTERLAILELRAARGWSLAQTARAFLVTAETIASWTRRVDEEDPDALVQMRDPVNKFPDFVRYAIQRLKTLCPTMGKVKIAETLCRAGLHLGATTVGRMLKEPPRRPTTPKHVQKADSSGRVVFAKYPNHLCHVDLTVVPTRTGFWTAWAPFSLPQCWPFCHWLAVAVDHYSRRIMGTAVFHKQPSSVQVRAFLGRTFAKAKAKPRHLVSDKGPQFWCDGFKARCLTLRSPTTPAENTCQSCESDERRRLVLTETRSARHRCAPTATPA